MTQAEAQAAILAGTLVTHAMVRDGLADCAAMEGDPFWEREPETENWFRRDAEYCAARGMAERSVADAGRAAEIALNAELLTLEASLPSQTDAIKAGSTAPNGLQYREICSFDFGSAPNHTTAKDAIADWSRRLLAYVEERRGHETLWWRSRPEIAGDVPFGSVLPRWRVYSRLMIGSRREIAERYAREFEIHI